MRIVVLDNLDSFVHNLVDLLAQVGDCRVVRNSADPQRVTELLDGALLCLSPGPGTPAGAGCMSQVLDHAVRHRVPTVGVCLGFQAILEHFGQPVAPVGPVHGRADPLVLTEEGARLIPPGAVGRYHSLGARTVPEELAVWARSHDGVIQAAGHRELPVAGFQFHPESVLTRRGPQILTAVVDHLTATTNPRPRRAHHDR